MDQAEQLRNIIKANNTIIRPVARVITVTSGKGGVGKSNTAINLAIWFKKMGQRVIILDADFGLGIWCLHLHRQQEKTEQQFGKR